MRRDERADARATERRSAMAPSTMRSDGREATDVTVVDLSQTGVRIATDVALAVGEEISVGLSGVGARRAYVAWRRDGEYGCAFAEPLRPQEATDAFTSVRVVRLGSPAAAAEAAATGTNAAIVDLYGGRGGRLRLPLDAIVVGLGYGGLLAWLAWRFLL